MKLKETLQDKSILYGNILDKLIYIKENFGFSQNKIERLLGYGHNYLSKVINGDSKGSTQLLAGLSILIELETLKKEKTDIIDREIEMLRKKRDGFTARTDYSAAYQLNDARESGTPPPVLPKKKPVSYSSHTHGIVDELLAKHEEKPKRKKRVAAH